MKTEYLPRFIKDLKKVKKQPTYSEIYEIAFQLIPQYFNLSEIPNLKKLKGEINAYRIRVGDYRIGVFINEDKVTFSRVLHRREIYKNFP